MVAILTLYGSATLLTSCTNEDNATEEATTMSYSVDGFSDAEGKEVYLNDMNLYKCIATTVVTDGKFHFSGTADKDAFMSIANDRHDIAIPFFNDGIAVTVNFNDTTLQGSLLSTRSAALYKEINAPMEAIWAEINSLTPEEQAPRAVEFQERLNAAWYEYIDRIDQIFIDERDNYIPVVFAYDYLFNHGIEAYDQFVAEGAYFASHPAFKKMRDVIAEYD